MNNKFQLGDIIKRKNSSNDSKYFDSSDEELFCFVIELGIIIEKVLLLDTTGKLFWVYSLKNKKIFCINIDSYEKVNQ